MWGDFDANSFGICPGTNVDGVHSSRPRGLEPYVPVFKDRAFARGDSDPFRRGQKDIRLRFGTAHVLRTEHHIKPLEDSDRAQ